MTTSDSRHLVDPELHGLLDSFADLVLSMDNLGEVRAGASVPSPLFADTGAAVDMACLKVPGPTDAPEVALALYRPLGIDTALPCILHCHGGGYVFGSPAAQLYQHRSMAEALSCCLVSVDYRLAPETRFPGAIEDCYAALTWLFENAGKMKIDPTRIGVMGESAGGGLAASLALLARDRGGPSLAFQHLIYPMIDDRTGTTNRTHPFAGAFVWTEQNNYFGWSALLGQPAGGADVSPYAAAARAQDLSDLPPAFVSTGALDLFVDEDIDYARRLMRAGVPVELHVYPGAFHGFDLDRSAAVSVQARRDSAAALSHFLSEEVAGR